MSKIKIRLMSEQELRENAVIINYLEYLQLQEEIDPTSELGRLIAQAIEEGDACYVLSSYVEGADRLFNCSACDGEMAVDELPSAIHHNGRCLICQESSTEIILDRLKE